MSAGRGVVVVAPGWVGDVVMAQSLFRMLRGREEGSRLDVLVLEALGSLLERMPEVDEVLPLPFGHGELALGARFRVARRVRARGYARAVVLRNSLKSALIPWLARVPRRTGYVGEMRYGLLNDVRRLDPAAHPTTVQRYVALGLDPGEVAELEEIPFPTLEVDGARQATLVEDLELDPSGGTVGLAPGAAFGPAKRWPTPKWEELAAELAGAGREVWVFGSPAESEEAGRIAAAAEERGRNLAGRTSLTDALDLLALCQTVVANDSGLLHAAAAVGTRVVALYGPTAPRRAPPLTRRRSVHWLGLECSPCEERTCPLGHHACLEEMEVDAVSRSVFATATSRPEEGP